MTDVAALERIAEEGIPQEPRLRALKGGTNIYYREPHRGHIIPASAQKMDVSNFVERNWKPLTRYGTHPQSHVAINYPLDELFRQGGAKELPVSQLIEEGWAYRDYYVDGVKVEFPQMRGATIPPLEQCPYCERKGIHEAIQGHLEVQHQRDLAPLKMAEIIAKAMKGEDPTSAAVMEIVEKATQQPYICGICAAGFNGHMPLAKHVKEHKNDSGE